VAVVVGVAAIVTIVATVSSVPSPQGGLGAGDDRACAAADLRPGRLAVLAAPCPLPEGAAAVSFLDGGRRPVRLADFRGKVVLVNLWATWCPPCVKEMPALDALQRRLGGPDFAVVAISQDAGGIERPKSFLDQRKLGALLPYLDARGAVAAALRGPGLPTSVLLDRQGREIARLVGAADWDSDAMVARIRTAGAL
jgi:thiol-disulfide isomerase/thioredoxin